MRNQGRDGGPDRTRICDLYRVKVGGRGYFHGRGLRRAIIEKDYYVTEALRIIASEPNNSRIILKGGTSLLRGWSLPLAPRAG